MKIKFLKAFNGDSILISFKDKGNNSRNILIDGGTSSTYKIKKPQGELVKVITELREKDQRIDLLVLTHVDDDHIDGILKWFEKDLEAHKIVGKVWFNSGRLISEFFDEKELAENLLPLERNETSNTSIEQGVTFEDYIEKTGIWDRKIIRDRQVIEEFGLTFKILSPTTEKLRVLLKKWEKERPDSLTSDKGDDYSLSLKEHLENDIFEEDTAPHNGSSIAFILNYENKDFLFLADAYPTVIIESLKHFGYSEERPLNAELVKISHHGSKGNNSNELLKMIKSNNFIISTNGSIHNHPNKAFLARLISNHKACNIYFNYFERSTMIFSKADVENFADFKALPINEDFEY